MEFEIEKIGNDILQQIQLEKDCNLQVRSIGLTHFRINAQENTRWLIRSPLPRLAKGGTDFATGNETAPTQITGKHVVLTPENTLFRDSPLGGHIIMNGIGEFKYLTPNKKLCTTQITTFSTYGQSEQKIADAINGEIKILSKTSFTFGSLIEALKKLEELEKSKKEFEKEIEAAQSQKEIDLLETKLAETKKDISELKKHIHRRINKDFGLGEIPILDPHQEAVKRSKILEGSLIINGGPGTGKTTALIQRIKFLVTEEAISELKTLKEADKKILSNNSTDWIFFSPTELLRTYLTNAMGLEGLKARKDNVVTWEITRTRLFRETGLTDPAIQLPFQKMTKSSETFFIHNLETFNRLFNEFEAYLSLKLQGLFEKILTLEIKNTEWKEMAQKIWATSKSVVTTKPSWIRLTQTFITLQEEFANDVNLLNTNYKKELDSLSKQIQLKLKKDTGLYNWIETELKLDQEKNKSKITIEEEEDEREIFEEQTEPIVNIEQLLDQTIKQIIRKIALKEFDASKLNSKEQKYYDKIKLQLDETQLSNIGKWVWFKKYFEPLTKGVEFNILQNIAPTYKEFRKKNLVNSSIITKLGLKDLNNSIKNDNNKRVHKDEMDFLLGFLFKTIRLLYKNNPVFYQNSNHLYIKAFKENLKGIIAVDEATDFNLFELYCMYSLTYPEFNCITFSGDIMQRMSKHGIKDWEELEQIIANTDKKDLKISYRQTPELLKIAQSLHNEFSKSPIDYKSKYNENENDPKALIYYSDIFEEKIEWLADRIFEINKLYGNKTPTIAIFVKNDTDVLKYSKALKSNEKLETNFISTVACPEGRILDDGQNVRVFSIEYIKGLEFEAVFFIDIDELDNADPDLMLKYIYVGVSRANFFLGLTINREFPEKLLCIKDNFIEDKWIKNDSDMW